MSILMTWSHVTMLVRIVPHIANHKSQLETIYVFDDFFQVVLGSLYSEQRYLTPVHHNLMDIHDPS